MHIGSYTFEEFKALAERFHGYAAPGLLIGGFMVELAKRRLPAGTLFEAVVETRKCLPDAVQLLTLCSTGNNWMKICDLGKYAVSLFDKHTGLGARVSLEVRSLADWPEIRGWFLKLKPKAEQDEAALLREIETAGEAILRCEPVQLKARFLGHRHMSAIAVCPLCGEAYPQNDGPICRGCQGEAPCVPAGRAGAPVSSAACSVPLEQAVGQVALHDMTRIEPGVFKGPEIQAGQRISAGDLCRLQQMGRLHIAVRDESEPAAANLVHENEAAEAFARRMAGEGVCYDLPPHEGKIDFVAERDGLLCVDVERLRAFNLVPEVMAASRQDAVRVEAGKTFAGTRAIPLFISRERLGQALAVLGDAPLFVVRPLRRARIGVLVTGTEVFTGLVEDRFIPVITAKAHLYGCEVARTDIVPDDRARIMDSVRAMRAAGADLLITTGGMSVDPDDVTRPALLEAGLTDVLHGMPVLPGTMAMVGRLPGADGGASMQVLGVPACAIFFKNTVLDLLLPRLLAGREITRAELSRLGDGGFCLGCKTCTFPKCGFGK